MCLVEPACPGCGPSPACVAYTNVPSARQTGRPPAWERGAGGRGAAFTVRGVVRLPRRGFRRPAPDRAPTYRAPRFRPPFPAGAAGATGAGAVSTTGPSERSSSHCWSAVSRFITVQ